MKDFTTVINGETLEYIDDLHLYLVDGEIVPSITDILKVRFGKKYKDVDPEILRRAAQAGTAVHEAIQAYIETGKDSALPEVRNFKFLQRAYGFNVLQCEVPVILHVDDFTAAGRLDLVLEFENKVKNKVGGADIKRTSVLDKDYLFYQLNLYRIAYRQSYGVEWEFLKAVHLRNEVRKLADIPINEQEAINLCHLYRQSEKNA